MPLDFYYKYTSSAFKKHEGSKASTHSLHDALNEPAHQLLSGGDEGFFLAQALQVVSQ